MKQITNKISFFALTLFAFLMLGTQISYAVITATEVGMYDFKEMQSLSASEMDGTTDVTAKLQSAVNASRDAKQTLFIPSGTYKISSQILCLITHEDGTHDNFPNLPVNIVGSAIDRPVIVLADNTAAFSGTNPWALFHYMADPTLQNSYNENKPYDSAWIMDGGIRGLVINLGSGNTNAVGIYWACAQYCYIEDIDINASDAFAGITGIGGANCLLANIKVTGGKHGLYLPEYNEGITISMQNAPQNTITGCTFVDQTDVPVSLWGWGGITVVGTSIITNSGTAINLRCDNTVYVFPFSLIDSKIEFTNQQTSNIAISNTSNGAITLRGVYSLGAGTICDNNGDGDLLAAGQTDEWTRVNKYNYVYKTSKITYDGPTFLANHYDAVSGTQYNTDISDLEVVVSVPDNLCSQHIWTTTPSFEDTDAVLVTSASEIQTAIDSHQKICLAKGRYTLSAPIILKENTILFGCPGFGSSGAVLDYGWTPSSQTWLIGTENSASATTYLMDITTDPGNEDYLGSLHWQAGRNSIIRNVRFDESWDELEKDMIRLYFSGNGGGRIFNYQDEKGGNPSSTNHRKVKLSGTSEPLTFYGLNLERGGNQYPESTFPMLEIDGSSNIRIFGVKTETSQPYASINNGTNIFMTNIIDLAHFGAVAKDYIEITGNTSDSIEITNSIFLKTPDDTYFVVADPWNTNEVDRTMMLGCYHRNWTSFLDRSANIMSTEKQISQRILGVYPNPISMNLTIELKNIKANDIVQIANIKGQIIREVNITSINQKINIADLPGGFYIARLKNARNVSVKFIKK